jgi:hypothetical protein
VQLLATNTKKTARLHLVHRCHLHGTIASVAAVKTLQYSTTGMSNLLVSFKDAKASFGPLA